MYTGTHPHVQAPLLSTRQLVEGYAPSTCNACALRLAPPPHVSQLLSVYMVPYAPQHTHTNARSGPLPCARDKHNHTFCDPEVAMMMILFGSTALHTAWASAAGGLQRRPAPHTQSSLD
jgi:hypothetical protein